MEGLASFMGQDEDSKDRMVLRDAVVNDRIPAITRNPKMKRAKKIVTAPYSSNSRSPRCMVEVGMRNMWR